MTGSQNVPTERPPKVTVQIEAGPSITLTGGDAADVLAICQAYLTTQEIQDPDLWVEIG